MANQKTKNRIASTAPYVSFVLITVFLVVHFSSSFESTSVRSITSPSIATVGEIPTEIPNIAHFIILGNTNVTFLQWLSIESADFYLKPSQIYIHADSPIVGKWATKIQRKPNVVIRKPVDTFDVINGHKVVSKAHVSDFIRAKVLYDYGGIYFDLDAIPLKNFTKLRQSGFECIVGEQANSDIGVGLLMAAPTAKLIGDWYESMQKVFDGRWTTHSVTLFTSLLSKYQEDTLILHRKSFFPLSWRTKDLEYLFNEGASEFDWNNSWAMHLYNSAVTKLNLEGYTNITIKGILERKTNFARAVWKVVANALDKDTISVDDVTPGDMQGYINPRRA